MGDSHKDIQPQSYFKKYLVYIAFFLVITLFTLYYIYKFFGKPERFLIITGFSRELIILLIIMLILYHILDGLRLYYILKALNHSVQFRHIFKLVFINLFISNITPFATGGGFAQVYFLQQRGIPLGNATAATTLRTVLATIIITGSTPIILVTRSRLGRVFPGDSLIIYLIFFTFLYSAIFYAAVFRNKYLKKFIYHSLHYLHQKGIISRKKYRKAIRYLFEHVDMFRNKLYYFFTGNPPYVVLTILFTLLFLLSEFSFSVILIRGMGYQVSAITIILMQVLVIFIMYFAPTPGASGVAEGGYSLLFSRFVEKKDIFPLIFSWRFFTKYIGITIGMIIFFIVIYREKVSEYVQN
ncbi:MAG: lysylphosphatidylglycerol synthase transmembrane domain-containing protein [Halanaerobiales bacterium]